MVYCGKPSKGCSICRERKIRCDQKEPQCGQCEKRQQQCPGYRNLVDLMFRDESSHVIKKAVGTRRRLGKPKATGSATKRLATGVASPSPSSVLSRSRSPIPVLVTTPVTVSVRSSAVDQARVADRPPSNLGVLTPESFIGSQPETTPEPPSSNEAVSQSARLESYVPFTPTPSLQERGTAFFFARYVSTDGGCGQDYSFIYDVWKPTNLSKGLQDPVTASMTAVGLAGLAQVTRCRETMTMAHQSYVIALGLVRPALRDPVEVVKDATMLAVLILGTYELISGRSPRTVSTWQNHLNGAAALASARGSAQFRTKAGVRMFLMLCQTVLASCIQSGLSMPQAVVDLRNELGDREGSRRPDWHITDRIYTALRVRHDIKKGGITNTDEILNRLSKIDQGLAEGLAMLPDSWKYRRVELTCPNRRVMGNYCHVYPGLEQAVAWNGVRAMRLLVLGSILEKIAQISLDPIALSENQQQLLVRTVGLMKKLDEAIVATVPQHFGLVSFKAEHECRGGGAVAPSFYATHQEHDVSSPMVVHVGESEKPSPAPRPCDQATPQDPTSTTEQEDTAVPFLALASASHTIIWPLYVLGMSPCCSPETKEYVLQTLDAICRETGLEQARIVAGLLQVKQPLIGLSTGEIEKLPQLCDESLPVVV